LTDLRTGLDPKREQAARAKAIEDGKTTVADFADVWLTQHVEKKLKPRTVADYKRLVKKWIKPGIGHLILSRVTKSDIVTLHEKMHKTPRQANYTVRTIGALMTYAEDQAKLPQNSNPCRRIKTYPERQRERFLSDAEIARTAEAIATCEREGVIGPHAAAGLRLALLTGARSGEVTAIQWQHIDWDRRLIRLADSDEPGRKTGARTIYLSEAAIELLRTIPRVGPFVIAGRSRGRRGRRAKNTEPNQPYKNLGRAWIIVRAKAGLPDVRLHDVRHSYASVAAGKGHSLLMIGKLLGHKVAATTQRYAHLTRDAASAVSDELGAALMAAIEKAAPEGGTVVKLRRRRRAANA
jgi:integrase